MRPILIFIFLFIYTTAFSQDKKYALQASAHFLANGVEYSNLTRGDKTLNFAGPALALNIFGRGGSRTIFELSGVVHVENQPLTNFSKIETALFGLRYESTIQLLKNESMEKIKFRLGFSGELSYFNQKTLPKASQGFSVTRKSFAFTTAIAPHIEYWSNEKVFFDLSPSLGLLSFGFEKRRTQNPTLTKQQQLSNGTFLDAIGFLIRFGVGVKF